MKCPNDHGKMKKVKTEETVTFRDKKLKVLMEHYVCRECGIKVDDIPLAVRNQKALADKYRKAAGMYTGDEIAEERKKRGWTQEALAKVVNVGIASIKRWEKGQIQNRAMDAALRRVFIDDIRSCSPYMGNRTLSLERIKLVLKEFSARLRRQMLKKGDKLLYAAKYLWYADFIAFRELGQSMTGATYARLPQGPQLNNYSDLIKLIMNADDSIAEPLTEHEVRIITKVAMTFPTNKAIYDASHSETVWKEHKDGELLPYSDAESIKGV